MIENGIGYDPWAQQLLGVDPVSGRTVLDVGRLVGVPDGGNPHQWYSQAAVGRFIERVAADLEADRPDAPVRLRAPRRATYESNGLAEYAALIARDQARIRADTPIGASESIVAPLARDARAEDGDTRVVPRRDRGGQRADGARQGHGRRADPRAPDRGVRLQQPELDARRAAARRRGAAERIPVATVTETLDAANATLPGWQVRELVRLLAALDSGERRGERAVVPIGAASISAVATVWRDVDLDIPEREFVAILGPNGVGKSTLLNAILGLVPLTEGEITVLGRPAGDANHEIGYLPQRRSFDPSVRIRGIDIVRLGLDGDRYGLPLPGARSRRDRAAGRRAHRPRRCARLRPAARSGSARAASSSGC